MLALKLQTLAVKRVTFCNFTADSSGETTYIHRLKEFQTNVYDWSWVNFPCLFNKRIL